MKIHANGPFEKTSQNWSEDSLRLIVTPNKTMNPAFFHIQEVGEFKTAYPYFTERARLNSFLILLTVSGEGRLDYRGSEYVLKAGDCFFINCLEHHKYYTPENKNWNFFWVHFNGGPTLGFFEEYVKDEFKIIHFDDFSDIELVIKRIIALNKKRDKYAEIISSNVINSLLTELLIESKNENKSSIFVPKVIKEIIKQIDNHFCEPITLDKLSDEHNLSKFHLLKMFKKYTGTTILEYIISLRISYAKELLTYSDTPVGEIAVKCGFNNVSHFINVFKQRENITPLSYRKEWKQI